MHNKLQMTLIMLLGSVLVYCTQATVGDFVDGGGGTGGAVRDASAEPSGGCCVAPPRTILFDESVPAVLDGNSCTTRTPELDIGRYRRVVIHVNNTSESGSCNAYVAEVKYGAAGFLEAPLSNGRTSGDCGKPIVLDAELGGVLRITEVHGATGGGGFTDPYECPNPISITVVGIE